MENIWCNSKDIQYNGQTKTNKGTDLKTFHRKFKIGQKNKKVGRGVNQVPRKGRQFLIN